MPMPKPSRRAEVLIVDDDPGSARYLAETIQSFGHHAHVSHSWTTALQAFGEREFDLVLMDAVMPGMDGFKLTRMLRKRARHYVPVLFITGLEDRGAMDQGIEAGADDFLRKPVDPVELRLRSTTMLRIRRLTADLEEKSRELEQLAKSDSLTGLANRREFDSQLKMEVARARRYDRPLSLLMIDLDHFKLINDSHGHAAGDQVLYFCGQLLSRLPRSTDMAFRYGGEELSVLLPETDTHEAMPLAERLRIEIQDESASLPCGAVTASIGVAGTDLFDWDYLPIDLLVTADAALYEAKRLGRNTVSLATPVASTQGKDQDQSDHLSHAHPSRKIA